VQGDWQPTLKERLVLRYWPQLRVKAREYALLTRLNRPIGAYLLLWPALWALWIAGNGRPHGWIVAIFILGTWLTRSAGCAINDYADRHFDPHVRRTRQRPLAAGRVSEREVLILFGALMGISFLLVLFLNWLTVGLSVVGALLAAIYPYTKRHTYLPQVFLGAAFGWAVPMAFAAQTGGVPQVAWLVFLAAVLWATVYDTMYAMVDREDDLKIGVKSTAILFGEFDRLIIGVLQLMLLATLIALGIQAGLGRGYYAGLAVATGLGLYHQLLIRDRDPDFCLRAFLHNNWLGLAVFAGIVVDYLLR